MTRSALQLTVNGEPRGTLIDMRDTLLDALRDGLGLTGSKEGCGNGNCGACTVLVDGEPVCACLILAAECSGASVETIEGVATGNELAVVQEALVEAGGTQCGFCTPGVVMSAVWLLRRNPAPTDVEIRHAIAGNICRCTGYGKIVEAIGSAAARVREAAR